MILKLPEHVVCVQGSVTGNDTIDLTGLSNGSTITLTEPLPTVVSTVTINGSGQNNLSISGANEFPILKVENADLTVSGITLTEARDISREPGGAISTDNSRLTINDSTLSENNAEEGAGVYSNNSSVIVNNSTISNNEAESGGAIYFSSRSILDINSSLEINNSTLSGNYAHIHGGAIDSVVSSIIINNSTISNNSAGADSGGMFSTSRTLSITNSTITGNVSNTRAGGINVASDFLNISNNIISGNASSTNITSEISVRFSFFSSTRNNLFGSNQVSDSEAFDGFILSSGNIIATHA